jgi:hypothetical protein
VWGGSRAMILRNEVLKFGEKSLRARRPRSLIFTSSNNDGIGGHAHTQPETRRLSFPSSNHYLSYLEVLCTSCLVASLPSALLDKKHFTPPRLSKPTRASENNQVWQQLSCDIGEPTNSRSSELQHDLVSRRRVKGLCFHQRGRVFL